MFNILTITACIYLYLMWMGWGATCFVFPQNLHPYRLWIMPWFGLIIIGVLSVWLSRIGIVTNSIVYILPLIGGILLFGCKTRDVPIGISLTRFNIVLIPSLLIGLFLGLSPLIDEHFLTSVSLGNIDANFYAIAGDYLKYHTIQQIPEFDSQYPSNTIIGLMLTPGHRPATSLVYSIISCLFRLPTYQIFTIASALFFALTPALIGILAWIMTNSYFSTLAALSISLFNVNFLFINYHGFAAQVIGQSILILSFILFYLSEYERKNKLYLLALALTLTSLFIFYTEVSIFFIAPYTLYSLFNFFRDTKNRKDNFKRIILVFSTTIIIDPIGVFQGISYILLISKERVGWPMPRWAFPSDILGFFSIHSSTPSVSLLILTSMAVLSFILLGIKESKNKTFSLSLFLFSIFVFLYFIFYQQYNYAYYKAVVFSCFFYIVHFSIGFSYFLDNIFRKLQRQYSIAIKFLLILVFVAINTFSLLPTFFQMKNQHLVVSKDLLNLSEIPLEFNNQKRNLVVELDTPWENLWVRYIFRDVPFSWAATLGMTDGHAHYDFQDSDLYLISKKRAEVQPIEIQGPDNRQIYWQNNSYVLTTLDQDSPFRFGPNWYGLDKWWGETTDSSGFRWFTQNATLFIESNQKESIQKILEIKFLPVLPKTTIDVYLNNRLSQTVRLTNGFNFYSIPLELQEGINEVRFHVREGTVIAGNGDPRQLAAGVNAIRLNDSDF